mgnify:CR=1 FL=1
MLRARGRIRSLEGALTISTKEKNIMLSNRRRFLQGAAATGVAATAGLWSHAASAKVAPVTLKDRNYEPLKLPRPISLAALTVLDVSPANQVLCAGNDPDINRLTDNYAELCELAHPYGLNLSIEPMP